MRVRVVCRADQHDWILGKIARRLVEALAPRGLVSLGTEADPLADVNHYVWYDDFRFAAGFSTVGITHIDSLAKLSLLRTQLETASVGICLSRAHMVELVHAGLPKHRLCYVTPAHDGDISPRKVRIGVTTRLYPPDPCKREWLLEQAARVVAPSDFSFAIMGAGWGPIVASLRARGFEVDYREVFDLAAYRAFVPTFDYYLYLGWDEGSMGLLDALHAGIGTIATPQGFHLDIAGALTYSVTDLDSLVSAFRAVVRERQSRTLSVADLTWSSYALRHWEIWDYLLTGRREANDTRDGLNALLADEPKPDASHGEAFLLELGRIDRHREELKREFEAARNASDAELPRRGTGRDLVPE